MQFAISQYVFLPRGIGFDGVQGLIVGRAEHLDRETTYDVRWLDHGGQIASATFAEKRLAQAQRKAKKAAKKAVKKKRR